MSRIPRRSFLAALAASGIAVPLTGLRSRRAAAGVAGARHLVLVFASGGWDTTYSIEPKDGTAYDIPVGTRTDYGGIPIWTDPTRPAVSAYFSAHAARTCVVNGIAIRSISHPECTRRILTGVAGSGNPDMGAIVGHTLGAELPIGYLMLGSRGYTGPLAASAGRVGQTNQIVALLDDEVGYPPMPGDETAAFLPSASEEAAMREFLLARAAREREVQAALGVNRARMDDFEISLARGDVLRSHVDDFGTLGVSRSFEQQTEIAAQMLATGVAWSVNIDAGVSLDTHDVNSDQAPQQEALFAGLSYLVDTLAATEGAAGNSLLDDTVVVVLSELTRTPKLNAAAGKDHWPVASALVIGAGVAGGRVVGGTDDEGGALFVDLDSGDVVDDGLSLQPANLAAGIVELVGGDPSAFYPEVEPLHGIRA